MSLKPPESTRGSALYDEVLAHYGTCRSNPALLSDTWAHTLRQKGRLFSQETLERMLELGNAANTWIDDFTFLIDATVLDLQDPIIQRLVELGEPETGRPRRDCPIGDRSASSNFVHHVLYAAKIIRAIEHRGIAQPRILEIGGGLGGVATLLRQYFGSRCTYFVVDLPEGLILQEWYLRNVFPDAPWSFKSDATPCKFVEQGLNFINAYALDSQDFPFDVALNIDSMQEMNRDAIVTYLNFIEKNISPGGLFYFQNNYGQSSSPIPEPSEYPLDARWTVELAEPAPQHECCTGAEQLRLVFYRRSTAADPDARRLVLRTLWNGFMTGRILAGSALAGKLTSIPQQTGTESAAERIATAIAAEGGALDRAQVSGLQSNLYLPQRPYSDLFARGPGATSTRPPARLAEVLWRAQASFLAALKTPAPELLSEIPPTLAEAETAADSSFYSAYYGAILSVSGVPAEAGRLLEESARRRPNPFWTVRFATLLERFGRAAESRRLLDAAVSAKPRDFFVALKLAELAADPEALLRLDPQDDFARRLSWAKTASRLGLSEEAYREAKTLVALAPSSAPSALLGILAADPRRRLHARIQPLLPPLPDFNSEESPVAHGFLLLELGLRDKALGLLEPQIDRFWGDYFRLGQIGRFFCAAGLPEMADRCLDRSALLRPAAFMHLEFIGNAYFGCSRFDRAADYLARALELKPTPRHIQARLYFSRLPSALRDSGRFGKPGDLRLVFQREQDFYHDLAPAAK